MVDEGNKIVWEVQWLTILNKLGIVDPTTPGQEVSDFLKRLPPEEASKIRRKYRKIWRSQRRKMSPKMNIIEKIAEIHCNDLADEMMCNQWPGCVYKNTLHRKWTSFDDREVKRAYAMMSIASRIGR